MQKKKMKELQDIIADAGVLSDLPTVSKCLTRQSGDLRNEIAFARHFDSGSRSQQVLQIQALDFMTASLHMCSRFLTFMVSMTIAPSNAMHIRVR